MFLALCFCTYVSCHDCNDKNHTETSASSDFFDHHHHHHRGRHRGLKRSGSSAETFLKLVYGRVVEFDDVDTLKTAASSLLAPYMRLCADDSGCEGTLAYALEARIDELLLQHWRMAEVGMILSRLRVLSRQWEEAHRTRRLVSPAQALRRRRGV